MSFDLPSLPEGWCYSSLGQLAQDKSITYGVVQPGSIVEDGVPIVRVNNIRDGRIELADVMKIAPEIESKYLRTRLNGGEVLITIVGSVGQVAIVPESLKGFNIARAVAVIHPREDVSPQWLAICLRSPLSQHLLGSRANTTVQTTINLKDLRELPVPMPPIAERQKIEELIYFLDDRIALLRETNATLEAIAQALFKSWFVDFDPVHAKARGESPQGMDDATAALFPDSFEESELGMIPKGWRVNTINDVVEGTYDGPHATPPESSDGPIFLGIKNLTGTSLVLNDIRHIAEQDFSKWTKRVTPKGGDIVFSYEATLGFFALVPDGMRCCLGRRLALVRPHDKDGFGCFWFHQFISEPFQRHLTKHTIQGATVNRIALKEFPKYPMLNPPHEIKKSFDDVASGIWEKFHINQRQAQTLAQLRDTLLPKLISGQLRLPEAEALLAEELP